MSTLSEAVLIISLFTLGACLYEIARRARRTRQIRRSIRDRMLNMPQEPNHPDE